MPNGNGAKLGPDTSQQVGGFGPYGAGQLGGQRQGPSLTNILMAASDMADRRQQEREAGASKVGATGIKRPNRGARRSSIRGMVR
jgi:hypothetical protein